MQYLAISTGSLVLALNLNGMMMSVFTLSPQTQVLPRRIGGVVKGNPSGRLFCPPKLKPHRSPEKPSKSERWLLPFVPRSSSERLRCKSRSRLGLPNEFLHKHHR